MSGLILKIADMAVPTSRFLELILTSKTKLIYKIKDGIWYYYENQDKP